MRTLTLKLTAPLQSYGDIANFEHRPTNYFPTKSAIVGMLANALGYEREDRRIRELSQKLSMAVRMEQLGTTLRDLQNVMWDRKKGKLKQTYRDYLQDGVFMVALGVDDNNEKVIDELVDALRYPYRQLFLGRRACTLAGPLEMKIFENQSPVDVLNTLPWQAAPWYQAQNENGSKKLAMIAEAKLLPNHRTKMIKDNIFNLDSNNRQYRYRKIAVTKIETEASYEVNPTTGAVETTHDPFVALASDETEHNPFDLL